MIRVMDRKKVPLIRTTATIPESLYWRFREETPRRRMSDKDALTEAISLWLAVGQDTHDLLRVLSDPTGNSVKVAREIIDKADREKAAPKGITRKQ